MSTELTNDEQRAIGEACRDLRIAHVEYRQVEAGWLAHRAYNAGEPQCPRCGYYLTPSLTSICTKCGWTRPAAYNAALQESGGTVLRRVHASTIREGDLVMNSDIVRRVFGVRPGIDGKQLKLDFGDRWQPYEAEEEIWLVVADNHPSASALEHIEDQYAGLHRRRF